MPYSIEDHRHRFSAWAASRAASTKTCRFNVLQGKSILESVGLNALLTSPDRLPAPDRIDVEHRRWRTVAIQAAEARDLIGFGHGIAAKLINVYLKSAFVCAGSEFHPRVASLHPPIDSLLLEELELGNVANLGADWAAARRIRWSKLSCEQYEAVIAAIRTAVNGEPLWQIESWWRGYQ